MEVTRIRYCDTTQREVFSILYYQGCGGRKAIVLPHGVSLNPGKTATIGESRVSWSGEMNESAFTVIHPRELQISMTKERWNCEDLTSKCPQCSPEGSWNGGAWTGAAGGVWTGGANPGIAGTWAGGAGATGHHHRPNPIIETEVWLWDALWLILLVLFILAVVWLLWYSTRR